MFNLLIIIAFVGVLVISAGFAGVTFMQGVQSALDAEITNQRLLDVATQVASNAHAVDPTGGSNSPYYSPLMGTTGAAPYAYNQVPSSVTSNAKSASGVPFEYCPYTNYNPGTGTAGTIKMPSGSTYNVLYYSSTTTGGQNYVTGYSGTMPTNSGDANYGYDVFGFLIAPAPNRYYPPDCSAVTTDSSGAYTIVSGGIVKLVRSNYSNSMNVPSAMTDLRFYVSSAPSGDGSGRDTSNYITLPDAMKIIKNLKPAGAMIYVDSTNCTASGTPFPCSVDYDYDNISSDSTYGYGRVFSYGTRIYIGTTGGSGGIEVTGGSIMIDEYSLLSLANGLTLQVGNTGALKNMTINGALEMADSSPTLTVQSCDNTVASPNTCGVLVYGGSIKGFSNINPTCTAASNCYISTMKVNGNVTVDGGGIISSSGPMVFNNLGNRGFDLRNGYVYGGTTMQFNTTTAGIVPIHIGAGGDMVAGTDTMTINATGTALAGGMVIDPGGRFFGPANSPYRYNSTGNTVATAINGSSVVVNNASNYGFYVHGEMDVAAQSAAHAATAGVAIDYPGATAPQTGIMLASGGKLQLEATTGVSIGTAAHRPTYGIQDAGGSGFFTMGSTGTNTIYAKAAGGTCWGYNYAAPTNIARSDLANLFSDSQPGTTNGNSTAPPTITFPNGWYRLYNNSSNWVCTRT